MLSVLYSHATRLFASCFEMMLKRRLKHGKEDPVRYRERKGVTGLTRPEGAVIWFHGASVGETISILPLIDETLKKFSGASVLVTSGTRTSSEIMAKRLPKGAIHQYIPMDHPEWVVRFLDHWRPSVVIWLESDFWPNMLKNIRGRDIPALLVNARMSETSFARWSKFGRGFMREILGTFKLCLAQNAAEQNRLIQLGHGNVHVTSNLKYASLKLPVDESAKQDFQKMLGKRPVWQFASTHEGEDAIALDIHRGMGIDNLLTVIIPRHPERAVAIETLIRESGLNLARRSRGDLITDKTDVYLADTIGEMGLFFETVPLTVIGGSFVPHGGHNPIEPAQFGNVILYGSRMFNFKTICYDFETAEAAIKCADTRDLKDTLKRFLKVPDQMKDIQKRALDLVNQKAAAKAEVWSHIEPILTDVMGGQS